MAFSDSCLCRSNRWEYELVQVIISRLYKIRLDTALLVLQWAHSRVARALILYYLSLTPQAGKL